MKKLLLVILLISSLGACSTISKVDKAVAWANQKFEAIDGKIADARDFTEAKVAELEANQAKFEERTGPWDTDGDSFVTPDEAKELIKRMAKDPSLWELFLSPEFLTTLLGILGIGVAGKKGFDLRKRKKDAHDLERFEQAKAAAREVMSNPEGQA